jgi:PKD repeat protein
MAGDTEVCPEIESVYFRDLTDGVVTGWLWDFGDSVTSTEQNPVHTYSEPGRYTVGLTVETPCGAAFGGIPEYITVLPWTHEDCEGPVATLLLGPEAVGREDGVAVRWTVQPPSPFGGYFVARAASLAGPWTRLHAARIPDRGAAGVRTYEYLDATAEPGSGAFYRLEAERLDGTRADYAVPYPVARAASAPHYLTLWMGAPAPSPSTGTVRIDLGVPAGGASVDLALYDSAGRRVATLFAGGLSEGRQAVIWDGRDESGRDVPAGIYFARASANGRTETHKLIVAR